MEKKKRKKGIKKEKNIEGKKQIKEENKILRNFIFGLIVLIVLVLLFVLFINSTRNFEYEGLKFKIVKEGALIFYKTSFPLFSEKGEKVADYNFFIRNDPRELKDIPFKGELFLTKNIVINMTGNLNCEGNGIIAIANLKKPFELLGINVIRDENSFCDLLGTYTFIQIQEANETKIEKFGPSCYEINVNNCEILEATERFMVETFIKING